MIAHVSHPVGLVPPVFVDRHQAGRLLAEDVAHLGLDAPVVLGLPRGGVPVAFEVASRLGAPLDVIVVRKLGVPFHPEWGMGAIGEGHVRVLHRRIVAAAGVSADDVAAVERRERAELHRRIVRLRGERPPLDVAGKPVVLVDDGIATGGTVLAAAEVARARGAAHVVVAAPVAAAEVIEDLAPVVDDLVVVEAPEDLLAVGPWYQDFTPPSEEEVVALLALARQATPLLDPRWLEG